ETAYGVEDDVTSIQKEILTHGPVEVAFEVYEDFLMYDGGIYVHTGGKIGGGHAVKMLGWGVEQGVPYWLVANSWNTDWGEDGISFMQRIFVKRFFFFVNDFVLTRIVEWSKMCLSYQNLHLAYL
uniref:Pept_C1 domain-containing protein n=1 Tax=Ascaris lumbricoides TaxID=6252 RepID=A0A0M3HJL1_ASCLU